MNMNRPVELIRKRNPDLVELAVAAYAADPCFRASYWSDIPFEKEHLRIFFREAHGLQLEVGNALAVFEGSRIVASASYFGTTSFRSRNIGIRVYAAWTRLSRKLRFPRDVYRAIHGYTDVVLRSMPQEPKFVVTQIAVSPDRQGDGFARPLLNAVFELSNADPVSRGVAISTYSERNANMYRHLGFEVIGQESIGEAKVWVLYAKKK